MPKEPFPYQPGAILHSAIIGAFRATGGSFEGWCRDNEVEPSNARNATYGVMKGPRGQEILAQLIEAAGSDVVRAGYLTRFNRYVDMLKERGIA